MASHVSNFIPSLTGTMFVVENGGYTISNNTMKEMEKKGGNYGFPLRKKLSFFIQRIDFSISHP